MYQKVKNILLSIIYNRILFDFCRLYLYKFTAFQTYKDWSNSKKYPMFYKHQTNLYSWYFSENNRNIEWLERGVIARRCIKKNSKVLDLCSGDGIYPFLFYADVAKKIDALDNSIEAINYSKKFHSDKKINYYQNNLSEDEFPDKGYDVVVWNAGLDYFTSEQQKNILNKIINSSSKEMVLVGMVPLVNKAEMDMNHNFAFSNIEELKALFNDFFFDVKVSDTQYNHRIALNFECRKPK